jgi:hypothetical protein
MINPLQGDGEGVRPATFAALGAVEREALVGGGSIRGRDLVIWCRPGPFYGYGVDEGPRRATGLR